MSDLIHISCSSDQYQLQQVYLNNNIADNLCRRLMQLSKVGVKDNKITDLCRKITKYYKLLSAKVIYDLSRPDNRQYIGSLNSLLQSLVSLQNQVVLDIVREDILEQLPANQNEMPVPCLGIDIFAPLIRNCHKSRIPLLDSLYNNKHISCHKNLEYNFLFAVATRKIALAQHLMHYNRPYISTLIGMQRAAFAGIFIKPYLLAADLNYSEFIELFKQHDDVIDIESVATLYREYAQQYQPEDAYDRLPIDKILQCLVYVVPDLFNECEPAVEPAVERAVAASHICNLLSRYIIAGPTYYTHATALVLKLRELYQEINSLGRVPLALVVQLMSPLENVIQIALDRGHYQALKCIYCELLLSLDFVDESDGSISVDILSPLYYTKSLEHKSCLKEFRRHDKKIMEHRNVVDKLRKHDKKIMEHAKFLDIFCNHKKIMHNKHADINLSIALQINSEALVKNLLTYYQCQRFHWSSIIQSGVGSAVLEIFLQTTPHKVIGNRMLYNHLLHPFTTANKKWVNDAIVGKLCAMDLISYDQFFALANNCVSPVHNVKARLFRYFYQNSQQWAQIIKFMLWSRPFTSEVLENVQRGFIVRAIGVGCGTMVNVLVKSPLYQDLLQHSEQRFKEDIDLGLLIDHSATRAIKSLIEIDLGGRDANQNSFVRAIKYQPQLAKLFLRCGRFSTTTSNNICDYFIANPYQCIKFKLLREALSENLSFALFMLYGLVKNLPVVCDLQYMILSNQRAVELLNVMLQHSMALVVRNVDENYNAAMFAARIQIVLSRITNYQQLLSKNFDAIIDGWCGHHSMNIYPDVKGMIFSCTTYGEQLDYKLQICTNRSYKLVKFQNNGKYPRLV